MSIDEMRRELITAYRGNTWKQKVLRMPEDQVTAIYFRFKAEKKI
jgi:hypothetical protein